MREPESEWVRGSWCIQDARFDPLKRRFEGDFAFFGGSTSWMHFTDREQSL